MTFPPAAAIPDGGVMVAMTVGELFGPVAALAVIVAVVVTLAVVIGLVADVRAHADLRQRVPRARVGRAAPSRPWAA